MDFEREKNEKNKEDVLMAGMHTDNAVESQPLRESSSLLVLMSFFDAHTKVVTLRFVRKLPYTRYLANAKFHLNFH